MWKWSNEVGVRVNMVSGQRQKAKSKRDKLLAKER